MISTPNINLMKRHARRWASDYVGTFTWPPETDDDGFQLVRHCKQNTHEAPNEDLLKIEAKIVQITKTTSLGETFFQNIECRPQLSRSINIPQNASYWISKTLFKALELERSTEPTWKTRVARAKFEARILSNPKGQFLPT